MQKRTLKLVAGLVLVALFVMGGIYEAQKHLVSDHRLVLSPQEHAWLAEHPVIRVARTQNEPYPPYEYFDAQGSPKGISPDYLNILENKLGVSFKYVDVGTYAQAYKQLADKEIDLVTSSEAIPGTADQFLFSSAYYKTHLSIISRKKQQPQPSTQNLNQMRIAAPEAYASTLWLKKQYPNADYVDVKGNERALKMLSFGEVDAVVSTLGEATYVLAKDHITNLRVAQSLDKNEIFRMAVRSDWPVLVRVINKGLAHIQKAEHKQINDRWIHLMSDQRFISPRSWRIMAIGAGLLLVVILAIFFWGLSLRRLTQRRTKDLHAELEQRRKTEQALRKSEQRWKFALEGANSGVWDWDIKAQKVEYTARWRKQLGFNSGDSTISFAYSMQTIHPSDRQATWRAMQRYLSGETERYETVYRVRNDAGQYIWILSRAMIVSRDAQGQPLRLVGTQEDITQRKNTELEMQYLAMHDALTGLANLRAAKVHFKAALEKLGPSRLQVAMLFLDINDFKSVNDTLGHDIGDQLIIAMAGRLNRCVDEHDLVCRQGGDEFLIILGRLETHQQLKDKIACIKKEINQVYMLPSNKITSSVSIGVAIGPEHGRHFISLQRKADMAMYAAKRTQQFYCIYNQKMDQKLARKIAIRDGLEVAMRDQQLELYYQPQFNLRLGHVVGAEALMRWHHPQKGMISPGVFIPVAEEYGQILRLGRWGLFRACEQANQWRLQHDQANILVAVNMSALQFGQNSVERLVHEALETTGLPADCLELEITESLLMENIEQVIDVLQRLQKLGVRVAIDDFGTGYSSLSYLKQIAAHKLKIDQSFVRDLKRDTKSQSIVRAIISMAKSLGMLTIAEGVETQWELEWLKSAGCDEVQGFYTGRPMPAQDFSNFLVHKKAQL